MKKAVAYARFSTDLQREESVDAQFRAIQDYCDRQDILLIDRYKDEGISGTSDDRPAFQAMIKASKSQGFDYVVVHKLDRFSRSKYDSAIYKRKLKENGVRVLSVLENLDDSPESLILESVLEGMSEYFSRNLSREVKKGMKENALKCKFNGGTPPLGYDVDEDNYYVLNPWEARAVALIFDMYANGYSYTKIIQKLNTEGYRTKKGKPFGRNSLYEILRNEKYIGNYIYSHEDYDGFAKKRNWHRKKARKDAIVIENSIPRIVDDHTWALVQKRREENKKIGGSMKAKRIYILSGLLYCKKCGDKMQGCTRKSSTGKIYAYYRCDSNTKTKYCKSINADKIEREVLECFDRAIFSEYNRDIIVNSLEEYSRVYSQVSDKGIDYGQLLADTEAKIKNIVTAISSGQQSTALLDELSRLENKKESILHEVTMKEAGEKERQAIRGRLKAFLNSHSSIKDFSKENQKAILSLFIESIAFDGSSISIKLKMIDPKAMENGSSYGAGNPDLVLLPYIIHHTLAA